MYLRSLDKYLTRRHKEQYPNKKWCYANYISERYLEALGFEIDTIKPGEDTFVSSDEEKILAILNEPESLDTIIKQTKLSASTVLASTTLLEIRGMIKNIGGGMYRKSK